MSDLIVRARRLLTALVAPTKGRHTRTARVRPYAPRVPHTPAPKPYEVPPRATLVRPYVLDPVHRARRAEQRRRAVDEQRLGVAVLMGLGEPAAAPLPLEVAR